MGKGGGAHPHLWYVCKRHILTRVIDSSAPNRTTLKSLYPSGANKPTINFWEFASVNLLKVLTDRAHRRTTSQHIRTVLNLDPPEGARSHPRNTRQHPNPSRHLPWRPPTSRCTFPARPRPRSNPISFRPRVLSHPSLYSGRSSDIECKALSERLPWNGEHIRECSGIYERHDRPKIIHRNIPSNQWGCGEGHVPHSRSSNGVQPGQRV